MLFGNFVSSFSITQKFSFKNDEKEFLDFLFDYDGFFFDITFSLFNSETDERKWTAKIPKKKLNQFIEDMEYLLEGKNEKISLNSRMYEEVRFVEYCKSECIEFVHELKYGYDSDYIENEEYSLKDILDKNRSIFKSICLEKIDRNIRLSFNVDFSKFSDTGIKIELQIFDSQKTSENYCIDLKSMKMYIEEIKKIVT